jgi:hypothetical protein
MVQACQWDKRKEKVLSDLPKSLYASMGRRLQEAFQEPTYERAKEEIL